MALIVDYDDLEALGRAINTSAGDWFSALENTSNAVKTLSGSPNIKGKAADNVKSYIETVHGSIITALVSILSAHTQNYLLYKREYQGNIDSALHARILQDEILDIKDLIQKNKTKTQEIDITIKNAIADISDIVYLGFPGSVTVERTEDDIIKDIIELDNDIVAVENRHYSADFTETGRLIDEAEQFILQQIGTHRQYKANFDVKSLGSNTKFINFAEALSELAGVQNGKSSAVEKAYEDEEKWQEQLYEERRRKAQVFNWVVTGACVVGSIAAITLTGGAAAPLVVASISGVSGFVSAGARNLSDHYVEHGDLNNIDWFEFGKDAALGGAAGFISGGIGAKLTPVATSIFSKAKPVASLLGSSSTSTRVMAHAFVGATTQSSVGATTRFINTAISTGGDIEAAWKDAKDVKSVLIDATIGGVRGGIAGKSANAERPNWRQSEIDAAKDYPNHEPQKSFLNGKEVPYGTKGSVRPDYYKGGSSVDIKNYDIETPKGRSSLVRNIEKQYHQREVNLPAGTKQSIMIDVRGQNVSQNVLEGLVGDIASRSNNGIDVRFKMK